MNQGTAKTLWLLWGSGLFYFVFDSLAAAQGWPFRLPGIKFDNWDRYAVALVAVPVGLAGLIVLCVIGICYARASGGSRPTDRLPPPFGLSDPKSLLLHITQIVVFVVLPLAGLAALFAKYLSGSYYHCVAIKAADACGQTSYEVVKASHFRFVSWGAATSTRAFVYQGGADYWPFWEPIGFCVLWAAALLALIWFAAAVRARRAAR